MRKLFFLLLLILLSQYVFSQIDKEFWFVGPEASVNHGDRPVYLRISTMEDTANIILRLPANFKFTPIYQTINPNSTFSIRLDIIGGNNTWLDSIENRPANKVLNKGILLTSDKLITSYYEIANGSNPGIWPLKGKNALGTEFYISGQNNYANQTNDGSEAFDIVASEDNTTVTITPTLDIVGHNANVPFQIILNKGQTYSARTLNISATASLMGSHVVSDKPIAITISDDSIITGGWDIIGDQIIPLNLLGWDYIVIKGFADNVPPNNNDERVYVLATKDNTDIFIDGNPVPVANLTTGQQYNYGIPSTSNTAVIKASEPVYVYHLSGHPGEAGASLLPQDSCTGSRKIGFTRSSTNAFAFLILTRNGNQDSFYLNGNNTIITGANFTVVPGTGNAWVFYRQNNLPLSQVPQGANILENTKGKFHLGIINNVSASSEYGYFSDFSTLYLGADASICPSDSLVLDGGPYKTSYEWKKLIGGTWTTIGTDRYYTVHDTGYFACMTSGDFCTLYDTIQISYYPNGTVNLGPDRTICEGTTTTFDPGGYVTYLWNTGSTNRVLTTGTGGQYWVRVSNNNDCIAFDTVMLFIDSLPQVNNAITGPASVCQGQSGVIYSIPSLPFTTSYQWTLPPGATGSSNTTTISLNFSPSAVSGILRVHGVNSCGNGPDTSFMITVNPTPGLSNSPPSKQICNNTSANVALTSNVTGTLFTWTCTPSSVNLSGFYNNSTPSGLLDQTLVNSGFTIETVTYHITPHANGCEGPVTDFVVTVYPSPNLSNTPPSKQICTNTQTNVSLSSAVSGTLFKWTATGSSLFVNGYSDNPIPATAIDQVLVNSGFNNETVTYHVTPLANGCNGPVTDYVVTVYPAPDLSNNPLNKTQCNNTTTNITLTSNVGGTLFTWTCLPSSVNLSGFYNNATPSGLLVQLLVNSGYNIETVTYHITPRANGCDGPVTDYVVTVYPTPDLSNNPLNMQVCNYTPTNQTLTSDVAGTLFTWTATGSSPLVSGYSDNAIPTGFLNQTLVNAGLNVEYVTYHMTPHANGCDGPVTDYVVTVVSSPDVYFNPPGQTICSLQTSSIQVLSHVPGTSFSWTTSATSPNLSGYSNSAGNTIAQTITNSGNTIESVTYTVLPTAWGCPPGAPQNVVLTVNPKPAITNSVTIFQQCSSSMTNVVLQSSVPVSSYSWTANGSSPMVSGFSAGSGGQIRQTLINTGYNTETVTYYVTPVANNCPGDPSPFTITVFPVPDVYFIPSSQTICPLQATKINNNSHVSGSSYTWTATGSSSLVSGYSPGSGDQIQQVLNNSGNIIETVTYHVSPAANGCPGINNNVVVTIDPAPVVSFTLCVDQVTTTNAQPIKLKGGNPVNGVYSGRGVSGSILYPALAGPGMDTILYSYTNVLGCSAFSYIAVSIFSPLPFTCGNIITDPRDSKQYPTVQIGSQCWMAANLDYGNRIPGTDHQLDNCTPEKYCYNNDPANCASSGGLYQWDELMQYNDISAIQGLCPPSWHLPTETEWTILFNHFISSGFAGSPLKYTGYSGFNALLSGVMGANKSWPFEGFATMFWSSTSIDYKKAWAHGMNETDPSVSFYPSARSNAFQVRCIKD